MAPVGFARISTNQSNLKWSTTTGYRGGDLDLLIIICDGEPINKSMFKVSQNYGTSSPTTEKWKSWLPKETEPRILNRSASDSRNLLQLPDPTHLYTNTVFKLPLRDHDSEQLAQFLW